jgi:hypothetical protein
MVEPNCRVFCAFQAIALHYNIQIATVAMFIVGMAYLTYKDYLSFLDLGPGGTPYNFYGYLTITLLRLVALRNPREAAPVPDQLRNTGYLSKTQALPKRKVPRPEVVGIAPHRQMNQKASAAMFVKLSDEIRGLAEKHPKRLRMGKSCFEKHCPALFSTRELNKTCNGEICHAHTVDGSMHLTLHPEDAEKVIQAGFGERHPLASSTLFFFLFSARSLPWSRSQSNTRSLDYTTPTFPCDAHG